MLKFTAFEVPEGDAFLIEKNGVNILIDGGSDPQKKFPETFNRTGINVLDLIVCSHADADHAEGIIHLLRDNQELRCNEIWIPLKWQRYIEKLSKNRSGFIRLLVDEIKSLAHGEGFEKALEATKRKTAPLSNEDTNTKNDDTFGKTISFCRHHERGLKKYRASYYEGYILNKILSKQDRFVSGRGSFLCLHLHGLLTLTDPEFDIFREALDKYGKLEALIDAVRNRSDLKILWYERVDTPLDKNDYDSFDDRGLLTPLCHRLLTEVPPAQYDEPLLEMLPNKNDPNKWSLVLASKNDEVNPLILITSDSDFEKVCYVPSASNMLITVPHHGSQSNKEALEKCITVSDGNKPVWIRGDSNRIKMSEAFLNIKSDSIVYCIQCREWNHKTGGTAKNPPQTIALKYQTEWDLQDASVEARTCICSRVSMYSK